MGQTLISFLGRVAREQTGYRKTRYRFPGGAEKETAFFGEALRDYLGDVSNFVILGTPGSMWDVLPGQMGYENADHLAEDLLEGFESESVREQDLGPLQEFLSRTLGIDVQLVLIPPALDIKEQVEVLDVLHRLLPERGSYSLDVTHGYRHLPMLALAAVNFLAAARPENSLNGLWYGSFEPDAGEGRAVELSGMQEILDWSGTWQRFNATGDPAVVAERLQTSNDSVAEGLRTAGLHQDLNQLDECRTSLASAKAKLAENPLPPPGSLFQPMLDQSTEWTGYPNLFDRQRAIAYLALERKDYFRAIVMGFEAFITRQVLARYSPQENNKENRDSAIDLFLGDNGDRKVSHFKKLRGIRNQVVHGIQGNRRIPEMDSENALAPALKRIFSELLGRWEK